MGTRPKPGELKVRELEADDVKMGGRAADSWVQISLLCFAVIFHIITFWKVKHRGRSRLKCISESGVIDPTMQALLADQSLDLNSLGLVRDRAKYASLLHSRPA